MSNADGTTVDFYTDPIDNAVSEWAGRQNSTLERAVASLKAAGNLADCPILTDLAGNKIAARIIDTQYGRAWAFVDEAGKIIERNGRRFVTPAYAFIALSAFASAQEKSGRARAIKRLEAQGYRESTERAEVFARFLRTDARGCDGSPLMVEIVRKDTHERVRFAG